MLSLEGKKSDALLRCKLNTHFLMPVLCVLVVQLVQIYWG